MDTFYRVGGKQPRNIYRVTPEHPEGVYVGVFFEEVDTRRAVVALNHYLRELECHRGQATESAG